MKRLTNIVSSATPSTGIQFREAEYGAAGARDFLRDVIAMANAEVEGTRYIVVGVRIDARGCKEYRNIDGDDFAGNPSYAAIAGEFIEPPLRLRYQPVSIEGNCVGVFEIADSQDKPYMMRVDHSETLRRGDAYTRVNDRAVKLGRRQLQLMFEKKFRESVCDEDLDIGFPGDIIHKDCRIPLCDLSRLPSAVATAKLQQLIDSKRRARPSGSTSLLARLTYARLFGAEKPYQDLSPRELEAEMRQVHERYRDSDENYLFEKHAQKLQIVVYNQGGESIRNASLSLVMPNHAAFHVADQLPKIHQDGRYVERAPAEQADYPSVTLDNGSIQLAANVGDIPAGELIEVFGRQPRLCVGKELSGRRVDVQYELFAQNLRVPARGTLRLLF